MAIRNRETSRPEATAGSCPRVVVAGLVLAGLLVGLADSGCNLFTGASGILIDPTLGAGGDLSGPGGGGAGLGAAGGGTGTDTGGATSSTTTATTGGAGGGTAPPGPTCDATAATGRYCGGDKVENADSSTLYQCNGPGVATVQEHCAAGCVVAPEGFNDYCASEGCGGSPDLQPPSSCDGSTTSELSPSGFYATSWFGCYRDDDGSIHEDPNDNCLFACGNQGLCDSSLSGPECEAELAWFSADADRFGCGGRIRVTNCENSRSVVLVALDRGPNCPNVEQPCDAATLDMSHPAMEYLFEGVYHGACDHAPVLVEQVGESTPLGPG